MPDQIRHDRRTLDCPDYYQLTLQNGFSTEDQRTQDEQNSRIALKKDDQPGGQSGAETGIGPLQVLCSGPEIQTDL